MRGYRALRGAGSRELSYRSPLREWGGVVGNPRPQSFSVIRGSHPRQLPLRPDQLLKRRIIPQRLMELV